MKLFCVLILAVFLENEAYASRPASRDHAADLARLIHLVVHQKDELDHRAETPKFFSEDYYMVRNEKPELEDTLDEKDRNVRFLIIKNPKVLEEFKKKYNYKSYQISREKSDNFHDLDPRRSAVFRLESSSIERTLRTKADENMMVINRGESSERRRLDKRNQDKDRNSVDVYVDNDSLRSKKGREETQDVWDVITKKYEWDKPKRERSKKQKNKMADDWDKVTKQDFDDWNKQTTRKRGRDDHINKPKKIDWDSGEIKPRKQKYSDKSYESKSKKAAKDWVEDVTVRTTKEWKSEPKTNWNNEHIPKIPSYYDNPRPKKRDHFESAGIFGRTPIPYVGRHGIYAD